MLSRIFSINRQTTATANFILQYTHAQIITTYCTGLLTDKPINMSTHITRCGNGWWINPLS